MTPGSARAAEFRERGFVVVKGLPSPDQVEEHVRALERLSGLTRASFGKQSLANRLRRGGLHRGWTLPDGVSKTPAFWDLVFHPGLLEVVRELISAEARFLQHTDLHAGFSAVAWHRDNVTRCLGTAGDWDESEEPYRLVRVGFYFQHRDESGFALGLVPGSHRRVGVLDDGRLARLERHMSPWRQGMALAIGRDPIGRQAVWVGAERGDAVLFDPRIVHSGSFIFGPKYSAFLGFGVPNRHFARHVRYYCSVRDELRYEPLQPALVERLRAADLLAPEIDFAPPLEKSTYRPGALQRFFGRRIRPLPRAS